MTAERVLRTMVLGTILLVACAPRLMPGLLPAGLHGVWGASSDRTEGSAELWMLRARRDIARRFDLPESAIWVVSASAAGDTIAGVELALSEVAADRLGYFTGGFPTMALLEAVWHRAPSQRRLWGLALTLPEPDGTKSYLYLADSLDSRWRRRPQSDS